MILEMESVRVPPMEDWFDAISYLNCKEKTPFSLPFKFTFSGPFWKITSKSMKIIEQFMQINEQWLKINEKFMKMNEKLTQID